MTEMLHQRFAELTLVDGSGQFCAELRRSYPQAEVVHSLFDDYDTNRTFDAVVMSHMLDYVDHPGRLLERAATWLKEEGRLFLAVPNARSLHRQAAVMMGLLANEHEVVETPYHYGYRRVYDPESLRTEVLGVGLEIEIFGGYWIKPLSNSQIDATWNPEMVRVFMALGERYPDIAAELYLVARKQRTESPVARRATKDPHR